MSFLLSLFFLSRFPACWASCRFPCIRFSLRSASTMEAFAELGFCCAWLLPHRGPAKIVSVRLNPSHGTIFVRVVCDFLSSVSSQQKFEVMEGPVLELHVKAQFYLENKGKYILKLGGVGSTQKTQKRSPAPSILAPLLLLLGLPCVNWACQEGSLFYLRSSLWSSDLPLFYFHGLSPALSFSHCHSGLIFPILTAECIHTYISFWVNFSEEP